jgi:hypothetical protein
MYVYVYVYVYVYTYACAYVYVCVRVLRVCARVRARGVYTRTRTRVPGRVRTRVWVRVRIRVLVRVGVRVLVGVCVRGHVRVRAPLRVPVRACVYVHVCMYEYACTCADAPRSATQTRASDKCADPNRGSAVLWEGGTLRSHPVVLCETAPFKPWVEWRRLTTAAVASGVTPGLNHKTSIPQNTIAECAWCGATERAGPQPKLINQWSEHPATAGIYRHGGGEYGHTHTIRQTSLIHNRQQTPRKVTLISVSPSDTELG